MNRLYVVNNGGSYSDNITHIVAADPDEWDNLEKVLLLCGDDDDDASVDATATEWVCDNCCTPSEIVDAGRFFEWSERKTKYVHQYDNGAETAAHFYRPVTRGVSLRDAVSLLAGWDAQSVRMPDFSGAEFLDLFRIATENGVFK